MTYRNWSEKFLENVMPPEILATLKFHLLSGPLLCESFLVPLELGAEEAYTM